MNTITLKRKFYLSHSKQGKQFSLSKQKKKTKQATQNNSAHRTADLQVTKQLNA